VTPIGHGAAAGLDARQARMGRSHTRRTHNNNSYARQAVLERKEPQAIAWASANEGGGRRVGFSGGHVHWNWAHDDFRKLVPTPLPGRRAGRPVGGRALQAPDRRWT